MEVTIGIEDLKERIHNTMKLKILAKEGGKEEKSKMSSDIQNYYKGIPGMIVEEMKQPGTLSNSMMQITTEHTAIIKKVGRNLVKSKNFNRNIRSTLHRTEPEASKEETLAQPTLAIIWYLMSKNITLEETLKMIITNNPTPSCKTNFNTLFQYTTHLQAKTSHTSHTNQAQVSLFIALMSWTGELDVLEIYLSLRHPNLLLWCPGQRDQMSWKVTYHQRILQLPVIT